ncbi:uncharacterized protein NECHADRAFT_82808 [Fusarium vanettenii 77-13-4]|uniref:Uncharacterized protein n=1 Tax=Fusarium vanettenii (strain ATCC MYA-4622 / CBS 123669 / FGSC 9596 / NRRL 45880 / 77-13-4) TaxID=660122 RepID=C7YWW6_FUSV7|nr:uncharacterized protein NECHADRAFT_82808 [Fusarium vanettenii 77-13-4]EEU43482.1 hypothetical protein NECHADRAFT_82808 [Fusarium vanettenii 77-13-4]
MHSFVTYTLLASASMVAALDPRFEFPDTVPALLKRQAPGTPQYACHEDCGLLITLGREEGYCDNDEWNERYGRCMICANTYNIWQYYRNGVTSAAEECGLSPTPSASGSSAAATTAEEEEPASTAAAQPSTTQAQEPATTADEEEEQTTAAGQPSTTAAAEETDDSTPEATTTGAAPEQTDDSETTAGSSTATTLTTAATPATESTDAGSAGTKTSVDEIGTIGVTGTPAPTTVIVNAGAKHFGLATAVTVAALAMLGLY